MRNLMIALLLYPFASISQDTTGRIDESFLKAIVHITIPEVKKIGTGFLVLVNHNDNRSSIYLVTNKHMIGDYSWVDSFKIYNKIIVDFYAGDSIMPIDVQLKASTGTADRLVTIHPNPKIDVAIINVSKYFQRNSNLETVLFDTSFLIRLKTLPNLKYGFGSQVFVIGYPANIMIYGSNQPIGKVGYIASSISGKLRIQSPVTNRQGQVIITSPEGGFFLVDGLIIGGNSGGPVVMPKDQNIKVENNQIIYLTNMKNYVIGMVSTALGNTGLTVVYSSDNILDLINLATKSNN